MAGELCNLGLDFDERTRRESIHDGSHQKLLAIRLFYADFVDMYRYTYITERYRRQRTTLPPESRKEIGAIAYRRLTSPPARKTSSARDLCRPLSVNVTC